MFPDRAENLLTRREIKTPFKLSIRLSTTKFKRRIRICGKSDFSRVLYRITYIYSDSLTLEKLTQILMAAEEVIVGGGGGESVPASPRNKVKLLCSHGGKILPRSADGHLKYVGGETRIVSFPRDINFSGTYYLSRPISSCICFKCPERFLTSDTVIPDLPVRKKKIAFVSTDPRYLGTWIFFVKKDFRNSTAITYRTIPLLCNLYCYISWLLGKIIVITIIVTELR